MIYEAILYQGMTIDLNTHRKDTHIHEHMQLQTQMTIHINQTQFLYILFMLTRLVYLSFMLINSKSPRPRAWYGFDEWSDWQCCSLFKIPWMLEQTFSKSILSLFCLIDADSTYFLAAVLSIDRHRGLHVTQQRSHVCVSACNEPVWRVGYVGKVSWQTTCILCFITPPAAGSLYITLPVKSSGRISMCTGKRQLQMLINEQWNGF